MLYIDIMFDITLDELYCFQQAAAVLNFRSAADAISRSPAAFGQRIQTLEEKLGVRLFERTTRSVKLTEDGLELIPRAERVLNAALECQSVGDVSFSDARTIVLGTRHELGLSWIAPMIDMLEKEHEGLMLNLYFGSGQDLLLRLREKAIDAAVTSTRLTDPAFSFFDLHDEAYVFVGSARLLKGCPLRSARDAQNHTLLDTQSTLPLFRYWRDKKGAFDSLAFGRLRALGTIGAIRELTLKGRGVAVLPEYFVAQDIKKKRLVEIMPKVRCDNDRFRLVFRKGDARESYLEKLAVSMRAQPLR